MKLNFENVKYYSDPFPHAIFRDVLREKDLEQITSEFPSNTSQFQKVMGGRFRLSSDEKYFYEFLANASGWSELYSAFNNEQFANFVTNLFADDANLYDPAGDFSQFKYDQEWLKKQISVKSEKIASINRSQVHEVRSLDLLKLILFRIAKRFSLKTASNPKTNIDELYLHMDISEATAGYSREIHHDNDNRYAAMVFYLSDKGDMVGGEFGIHKYKDDRDIKDCEPHPNVQETELVKLVAPEKNMMLLFLSTPNSYHSVPEVMSSSESRKFFYAGLTVKKAHAWKNVIPTKL